MADGGVDKRGGGLRRRLRYAARRHTPASETVAGGAACRYLAIIMDGNGRWARRRRLPVAAGHRAGAKEMSNVFKAERRWSLGLSASAPWPRRSPAATPL